MPPVVYTDSHAHSMAWTLMMPHHHFHHHYYHYYYYYQVVVVVVDGCWVARHGGHCATVIDHSHPVSTLSFDSTTDSVIDDHFFHHHYYFHHYFHSNGEWTLKCHGRIGRVIGSSGGQRDERSCDDRVDWDRSTVWPCHSQCDTTVNTWYMSSFSSIYDFYF